MVVMKLTAVTSIYFKGVSYIRGAGVVFKSRAWAIFRRFFYRSSRLETICSVAGVPF